MLVSCAGDGLIRVYPLSSNQEIAGFYGIFNETVTCVKISPKKTYLAAGSVNSKIGLWAFGIWTEPLKVLEGHDDKIRSLIYSSDETTLISSSKDTNIRL